MWAWGHEANSYFNDFIKMHHDFRDWRKHVITNMNTNHKVLHDRAPFAGEARPLLEICDSIFREHDCVEIPQLPIPGAQNKNTRFKC